MGARDRGRGNRGAQVRAGDGRIGARARGRVGAATLDATRSRIGGAKKEQRALPVTEDGLGDDVIDFSYLDSTPIRNEPGSASATAVEALVENAEEEAPRRSALTRTRIRVGVHRARWSV